MYLDTMSTDTVLVRKSYDVFGDAECRFIKRNPDTGVFNRMTYEPTVAMLVPDWSHHDLPLPEWVASDQRRTQRLIIPKPKHYPEQYDRVTLSGYIKNLALSELNEYVLDCILRYVCLRVKDRPELSITQLRRMKGMVETMYEEPVSLDRFVQALEQHNVSFHYHKIRKFRQQQRYR